jgi:hypothetical protein
MQTEHTQYSGERLFRSFTQVARIPIFHKMNPFYRVPTLHRGRKKSLRLWWAVSIPPKHLVIQVPASGSDVNKDCKWNVGKSKETCTCTRELISPLFPCHNNILCPYCPFASVERANLSTLPCFVFELFTKNLESNLVR